MPGWTEAVRQKYGEHSRDSRPMKCNLMQYDRLFPGTPVTKYAAVGKRASLERSSLEGESLIMVTRRSRLLLWGASCSQRVCKRYCRSRRCRPPSVPSRVSFTKIEKYVLNFRPVSGCWWSEIRRAYALFLLGNWSYFSGRVASHSGEDTRWEQTVLSFPTFQRRFPWVCFERQPRRRERK